MTEGLIFTVKIVNWLGLVAALAAASAIWVPMSSRLVAWLITVAFLGLIGIPALIGMFTFIWRPDAGEIVKQKARRALEVVLGVVGLIILVQLFIHVGVPLFAMSVELSKSISVPPTTLIIALLIVIVILLATIADRLNRSGWRQ
jgi:hypothetical protein